MTETDAVVGTLTKDDVAALRKADTCSFHWTAKYSEWRWQGDGSVVLSRRLKNAGPLDEQERRFTVAVQCSLEDYGTDKARDWPRGLAAFEMLHTCQCDDRWQTIVGLVRPGDVLCLRWVKDNDNGYLKDTERNVRLHRDEMQVIVRRGDKRLTFDLCCNICPDNTARSIRPA